VIIKAGDRRLPIWPEPPSRGEVDLPRFCPTEHRGAIVTKFRIHLHQHPEIPFNDAEGTHLTADEIHEGAVSDMYHYCHRHDLSQVWAYMWNCWYNPQQWPLWARSACPEIPRLKATMICESTWRVIKHQDLALFNRPRLDLVTHVIIKHLIPRSSYNLATILGQRHQGRGLSLAEWQKDFRSAWKDMSRPDEIRLMAKELEWLYKPKKTKGRAERLVQIQADADRPAGTYHTDIMRWTCSCPAYLISRFLTCKHIVRQINQRLDNKPLTDLEFFAKLRRQHSPPFFRIEGIHFIQSAPETVARAPRKVLRTLADINTHASEAPSSEGAVEDTTGEHSPDSVTRASSPEYCNTSSLEEGSSSAVEEGEGSERVGEEGSQVEEERGDSGNVRGSAFTDTDSTNDSHVSCCGCALHLPC
jgi:hypothetical protein